MFSLFRRPGTGLRLPARAIGEAAWTPDRGGSRVRPVDWNAFVSISTPARRLPAVGAETRHDLPSVAVVR
jgi:hypothetical protein